MPDDDNVVYIGSKPPMSYVMAVMRTFNETNSESVVLKARGRAISSAVDVAEITRNRFLTDLGEPKIDISTEELPSRDGGTRGVSSIAITLPKLGGGGEESPEASDTSEEEEGEENE